MIEEESRSDGLYSRRTVEKELEMAVDSYVEISIIFYSVHVLLLGLSRLIQLI